MRLCSPVITAARLLSVHAEAAIPLSYQWRLRNTPVPEHGKDARGLQSAARRQLHSSALRSSPPKPDSPDLDHRTLLEAYRFMGMDPSCSYTVSQPREIRHAAARLRTGQQAYTYNEHNDRLQRLWLHLKTHSVSAIPPLAQVYHTRPSNMSTQPARVTTEPKRAGKQAYTRAHVMQRPKDPSLEDMQRHADLQWQAELQRRKDLQRKAGSALASITRVLQKQQADKASEWPKKWDSILKEGGLENMLADGSSRGLAFRVTYLRDMLDQAEKEGRSILAYRHAPAAAAHAIEAGLKLIAKRRNVLASQARRSGLVMSVGENDAALSENILEALL